MTRERSTLKEDYRRSKWRAIFRISDQAQIMCELMGANATELARTAIDLLLDQYQQHFRNMETYCVAHSLMTNSSWREIAVDCDDYMEFIDAAEKLGITQTPTGIHLRTKIIARSLLNPIIRATRRDEINHEKKKGKAGPNQGFLLPPIHKKDQGYNGGAGLREPDPAAPGKVG